MRLGGILFVLPFMFVLNPSLILQGPAGPILVSSVTAVMAMWTLASGSEGYLYRAGMITWPVRILLLIASFLLIVPGLITDSIGLVLVVLSYVLALFVPGMRLKNNTPLMS